MVAIQYLKEGPTRQASRLRFVVDAGQPNQFYVLDSTLGPPEINLKESTLQMFILSGILLFVDAGQIDWVLPIGHDSLLRGSLHFDKIAGQDVAGNVVLNLAAAAFEPSISGADPASTLPGLLGQAISTYYKTAATQIPLGTIVTGQLTPALQPKNFHFFTQQKADSDESCLVLFIQTNGQEGKIAPLAQYPLSADISATLVISDAVVFAGVVPLVSCAGLSAAGHQEKDARWSTVLSGTIDAGLAGDTEEPGVMGYSTDQYGNYAPILVPVNGLKVLVEQGNIASDWSTSWRQYYLSPIRWPCHLDMTASFSMSGAPQVDPDTCVVSFKGTPELKVTGGDDFLSACNITPLQLTDAISGSLQPLASLQLMQLDTFALANLVFPSGHKVRLTSAKLPQDLILQGTMVVPLTVQPDRVSLTPGATQQFSIAGGESVSWAVQPASRGTISNTGLYTAPATPSQTEVVSINAVSTKDLNRVGRAMAVIAPAKPKTGISISPNSLRVAAGKTVAFTVTNDAGTPLEASVDLDPVGLGTLLEGFGTGQWTYSAPSQIAHSATVRIVAKMRTKLVRPRLRSCQPASPSTSHRRQPVSPREARCASPPRQRET